VYFIPKEFSLGGVYFPPLLIAGILGLTAAVLTTMLLNRYRLSRYFSTRHWFFWRWRLFIR